MGANALDCPERNGLGFAPTENYHMMSGLSLKMERLEGPVPRGCGNDSIYATDTHKVFAARHSVVDDETETESSD